MRVLLLLPLLLSLAAAAEPKFIVNLHTEENVEVVSYMNIEQDNAPVCKCVLPDGQTRTFTVQQIRSINKIDALFTPPVKPLKTGTLEGRELELYMAALAQCYIEDSIQKIQTWEKKAADPKAPGHQMAIADLPWLREDLVDRKKKLTEIKRQKQISDADIVAAIKKHGIQTQAERDQKANEAAIIEAARLKTLKEKNAAETAARKAAWDALPPEEQERRTAIANERRKIEDERRLQKEIAEKPERDRLQREYEIKAFQQQLDRARSTEEYNTIKRRFDFYLNTHPN